MSQNPIDSWENIEHVPDALKLKTIYMMLMRSTMIAMANSFHIMAIVNQLHDKGILDKNLVEKEAMTNGAEMQEKILHMSEEVEKDIQNEARDLWIKEHEDLLRKVHEEELKKFELDTEEDSQQEHPNQEQPSN